MGPKSHKQVPKIQERVFLEKKKEPLLGKPEESSPSWLTKKKSQLVGPTNWAN